MAWLRSRVEYSLPSCAWHLLFCRIENCIKSGPDHRCRGSRASIMGRERAGTVGKERAGAVGGLGQWEGKGLGQWEGKGLGQREG